MHDLERNAALERFPHRLVDHAHAPFADYAEDAVIAQPLGKDAGGVTGDRSRPGRCVVGVGRACIALRKRRAPDPALLASAGAAAPPTEPSCSISTSAGNSAADLVGQGGVAPDVLGQRRPLTLAETSQE